MRSGAKQVMDVNDLRSSSVILGGEDVLRTVLEWAGIKGKRNEHMTTR